MTLILSSATLICFIRYSYALRIITINRSFSIEMGIEVKSAYFNVIINNTEYTHETLFSDYHLIADHDHHRPR